MGQIVLPMGAGVAPDFSGSGNDAATIAKVVSNGTQTSGTPKASHLRLLFDDTTAEHWMWQFPIPADYTSGGSLKVQWGAPSATSGDVVWKGGIAVANIDSGGDTSGFTFVAKDSASAGTTPSVAGRLTSSTITLTMTNVDADDFVVVFVGRDTGSGSDTLSGDAFIAGLSFSYS